MFNPANISILVDYAHEPESLKQLFITLDKFRKNGSADLICHIYSATGAGRDIWKRPLMSKISAEYADLVMLTEEDHGVDDNLAEILNELQSHFTRAKKVKQLWIEPNRRQAFKKTLLEINKNYSHQKIILVSTAMGSQSGMETSDGVVDWDERQVWAEVWKEFLQELDQG
jgi:UDP-N-acetylmuramoyl-L-alanyl-D-glutamate--2,6-diaminopimelate ligase